MMMNKHRIVVEALSISHFGSEQIKKLVQEKLKEIQDIVLAIQNLEVTSEGNIYTRDEL